MPAITSITDLRRSDARAAGTKAATLAELARAGFAVPAGFVVGADVYLDAMQQGGVRDELRAGFSEACGQIDDPAALARSAERLRALVRKAGVASRASDEIIAAYHRLGDAQPVAVRSSATVEDAPSASFAGMHDSYVNVVGDDALLDRLVECWVSLFGDRVITYRAARGIVEEPAMAVLVQLLVRADCAGVMFTADPSTADTNRMVIEASYGLGEAPMGGEVDPDTYVVTKDGPRLEHIRIGAKSHMAVVGATGVTRVDVSLEDSRRRVLGDDDIGALARLGIEIEAHLGGVPLDIEWAIADGSIHVLQARPISTLASPMGGSPLGATGHALLRGLAAAPGVATGPVRVLMSPEHGWWLTPGEVLVAPMTNPEWVPAIRRSAALVTDGGGMTCHGAIVARELGVPCVVATRVATSLLRDGQVVAVDGGRGVVGTGDDAARMIS